MRLSDPDAHFIGGYHDDRATGGHEGYRTLSSLEAAQGLQFQCPLCAQGLATGETLDEATQTVRRFIVGAHYLLCWFRNPRGAERVADSVLPGPGRWWAEGSTIEDLTFAHGKPSLPRSVFCTGPGCSWHGYVTAGEASLTC